MNKTESKELDERCKNCKVTFNDWQRCYSEGFICLRCWHEVVLKAKKNKNRYEELKLQ